MNTGTAFLTLLIAAASARIYILFTRDKITQPLRYYIVRHMLRQQEAAAPGLEPFSRNKFTYYVEYLLVCPLCFPTYPAAILTILTREVNGESVALTLTRIFAAAYGSWYLLNRNNDLHPGGGNIDFPDDSEGSYYGHTYTPVTHHRG